MVDETNDMGTEARGDRIAKWLARSGVASRRDIERMIAERRIKLNGVVVDHPATFVTSTDAVSVDGNIVQGTGTHPSLALPQTGWAGDNTP